MPSSCLTAAARSQYLLDLLAQFPGPRKRRGRRHWLGGLLAVGIAGGDRGLEVVRRDRPVGRRCRGRRAGRARSGPRAGAGVHVPARVRPDQRGGARPGHWRLASHQGDAGRRPAGNHGRRQGRPRRPEQGRESPAPGRGPGARYRRGPGPGRRGREVQTDPCRPGTAEAFTGLAGAVITAGALHTQGDTAQAITGRHAGYVLTVKASMPALCKQLKKLPWTAIPRPRP
jgi:hypothetical protein